MKDRFDLEQDIMTLWTTADDIKVIWESISDSTMRWSTDDICNVLLGLEQLVQARGDRCFNTFEQVMKLNDYADEDVKAMRNNFAYNLMEKDESTLCGHAMCKFKEAKDNE